MRVVLDTNIIVSGLNFDGGNEARILDLGLAKQFDLYLSPFILAEVASVLPRKFDWDNHSIRTTLETLQAVATIVESPPPPDAVSTNRADDRVLACAAGVSADYLVTGDRRHLLPIGEYQGTRIVTARQFLSELEEDG